MAAFLVQPLHPSQTDSDNEDDPTYSDPVLFTSHSSLASSTCDEDSDTLASTPHNESMTEDDSDIDSQIEPVVIKFAPKMDRVPNSEQTSLYWKKEDDWDNYDFSKCCKGVGNLEWTMTVWKDGSNDDDEVLKVGVQCDTISRSWKAEARVQLKIGSGRGASLSTEVGEEDKYSLEHVFEWDSSTVEESVGKWKKLIQPKYKYVDAKGNFNLEAKISFYSFTGVRLPQRFDFCSPSTFSDIILNVRGTQLHVSKQVLAVSSPVFQSLFFGEWKEKDSEEITIKRVAYKDFVVFLNHIYSPNTPITEGTVESLLALADRYATEALTDKLEEFLLFADEDFSLAKKLLMADKYRLINLQDWCLNELDSMDNIKNIWSTKEYGKVSDKMKVALFENMVMKEGEKKETNA